ncbi:RNA polymerase III transcription factor (TF)IIICsubunit tau/Tfc1p [Cryptosporidium canis]|uniref:RNA polymerase III transcription factor (TF)IIICsubunit tau/Tfc1p n=1 Tax=Cryptosporidium canis TaxID=195482 RepID=A0A9D5DNE6_9CRYT|nr:RNA polymerase III transcription factor (TF)IIICsubunit tau/Tfc1p [Cryptosporidium canis]
MEIPIKSIVCVEIPGRVENLDNAIFALGGMEGIEESVESSSSMKLLFCREDPYNRPIYSDFMKRTGILLRKLKYSDGRIDWRVVGDVSLLHQFTQMADFYFIPPPGFRDKKTIHEKINEEIVGTPFIPPAVFSKVTQPVNIKWIGSNDCQARHSDSNAAVTGSASQEIAEGLAESIGALAGGSQGDVGNPESEMADALESEEARAEGNHYWNVVVKYSDTQIPSTPLKISSSINLDKQALDTLRELFKEQPLWLRPVIESRISPDISAWKRKLLFTQVCYNISDGPWRACLCRLGYDPRKDPESRKYQTMDFRDPYLRKVLKDKRIGINVKAEEDLGETLLDWQFKVPPKRGSQIYQLSNIEDSHIQKVIGEAVPLESCTRESGWFKKSVIDQIRELLSLKCEQMRQLDN